MRENWNDFWNKNKETRFTKISWSKRRMMKILDKYITNNLVVLDAGSGSGFFSNYFLSKNCKVYSLDYSDKALEITKTLTNNMCEGYLKRDLLDLNLGDEFNEFFDIVFSDGLFEHFSENDQRKIISNFVRMKKQKGLVITFVPNKFTLWTLVRPFFMPQIKEVPFTLNKLRSLHSELETIQEGGINVLPIKRSPDRIFGRYFGMLLYVVTREGTWSYG